MDNLDYIDSYFTSAPDPGQTRAFENRIHTDPAFAEEVAFYLTAAGVAEENSLTEKKERFKIIYQQSRVPRRSPVKSMVIALAVAAVITGVIFGIYTFFKPTPPPQLASQYEKEQLQNLGVTMSGKSDSLQMGLRLYNDGKFAEALTQFEKIINADTANYTAIKYAGITALRLKRYDQALFYFTQLQTHTELYANPGLILQSVTLMERNQPGDAEKAKILLQRIADQDLEGKEFAQQWLKKM